MNADPNQAKAIFLEAVEKHDPEGWPAFLDQACAGQAALRGRVEVLLGAHREAGTAQHKGAGEGPVPVEVSSSAERAGTVIGPYKLLQQIGEGGMGTVFMAEQTHPVQRKVALKVIKPGMDSQQVIARFEAERQALAMMDHVNIARVLDAGATESGLPYFVMELVHGVPITKYCDDNHLTPRERLELFVPVCQAIQHAHQKGIIHRDIKPSNVMVTLYDGKPVPKVIDFGVAKATEQKLTERTLFTQYGSMVGTPQYMSPEQAEMSALGADTRSDIFSLGVLLYELLTGSTPLSQKRLKEAAYGEVLRMIKEEEPPRPSTRVSDSGEALASISAQRHTEPAKLTKLLRGELDWIVMKCLEKDRNRRYETANGIAADVQRYLNDEAVEACPPSVGYRFRKFARRNKVTLLTVTLVAAALLAGTGVSIWQAAQARRAEANAVAEQRTADANFRLALHAVERYFTMVSNNPGLMAAGFENLRRDLLRTAREFYEKFVEERPHDPALRQELGRAHRRLGLIAVALGENTRALEYYGQSLQIFEDLGRERPDDAELGRDLAGSHREMAKVYADIRKWTVGETAYKQALFILERLESAHPEDEQTLKDRGEVLHSLANLYLRAQRRGEAEAVYQRALSVGEQLAVRYPNDSAYQVRLALSRKNLGQVYYEDGKFAEAEEQYTKSLPTIERQARDHPRMPELQAGLAAQHTNLALLYMNTNRPAEAEKASREAIGIQQRLVRAHPLVPQYQNNLAVYWSNLAALYFNTKRLDQAAGAYTESAQIYERLTHDYPDILKHRRGLAGIYGNMGIIAAARDQQQQSLEWYDKSIDLLEEMLKRDAGEPVVEMFLANGYDGRACALLKLGRPQEAVAAWDRAVKVAPAGRRPGVRLSRGFGLVRASRFADAAAEASALADPKEASRATLYSAACIHSLCSGAVRDQADLRQRYATRAIEFLRRATVIAPFPAAHIKDEKSLEPLRGRKDFQAFVKELEAQEKTKPLSGR